MSSTDRWSHNKGWTWSGRIVSGIPTLFLLFDALGKVLKLQPVVEGTVKLGYSDAVVVPLGVLLGVITVLYAVPRTAVLAAILLTGYLGGAVATHVRTGDSMFSVFFPVIIGAMLWGGLWLRDHRLRMLVPVVGKD